MLFPIGQFILTLDVTHLSIMFFFPNGKGYRNTTAPHKRDDNNTHNRKQTGNGVVENFYEPRIS